MAKTTNSNYKCRKYSFGGGVAVGSILGGYLGYKIGRARPQKAGFETEKKIGRKLKQTAKDVRGKRKTQKMAYGGRTRRYYNNDPRIISSRFDTTCAETGKPIKKGEKCVYYPKGRECFSMNSKQAQEFNEYMFDLDMGSNYAKGGLIEIDGKMYRVKTEHRYNSDGVYEPFDVYEEVEKNSYADGGEISRYSDFKNKVVVKFIEKDNGDYVTEVLHYPSGELKDKSIPTKVKSVASRSYIKKLGENTDGILADGSFTEWVKSNKFDENQLKMLNDIANKYNVKMPTINSTYAEGGGVKSSKEYRIGDRILFNSYRNGTSRGEIIRELDDEHFEVGSGMGMAMVNKSEIVGLQETPRFSLFEQGGSIDDIITG